MFALFKKIYLSSAVVRWLVNFLHASISVVHSVTLSNFNAFKNRGFAVRRLEIGPGMTALSGFETLNVRYSPGVTYVANASARLKFSEGTFDEIFASHVLEHMPWYQVEGVILEWVRILKPGGKLTIWVPDGYKVAKSWVDFEDGGSAHGMRRDSWYKFNDEHSVVRWVNGRIFSYGDGLGTLGHPNWHLAVFSESYLHETFAKAGLLAISTLSSEERLGNGHGWIEIGVSGRKQ